MFPDEWVVETAGEGAGRVLEATRAGAIGERAASLAEWTLGRYDWSVVRPQLDALLLDRTRT